MRGLLERFARERRGGIATIVAFSLSLIMACAALAIDLGSIYLQSRQLQGVADLAALAAARDLGRPQAAADATVAANALEGPVRVDVTTGAYDPDPALPAAQRFRAGVAPVTGVRVRVHAKADLFFGSVILGRQAIDISRTATAAETRLAALSVGSRLASLDGGAANAVLSGLTGNQVRLSLMDYQALAAADIDLLQYTRALGTHLELQGASFDEVLEHDITTSQALSVLADVLAANGRGTEASSMRSLATAASGTPDPDLQRLVDLGRYGAQDQVSGGQITGLQVGALELAEAILALAQGGRQVELDLAAGVPGLTSARAWLAIGERPAQTPWLAVGRDGSVIVRTAQARLYVEASLAPGGIGHGIAQVRLPILVEAARAEARISSIDCGNDRAVVEARPGIARLAIGDIQLNRLNDFTRDLDLDPARIVSVPLISATAEADIEVGGQQWTPLTFTRADITAGTVRSVQTEDIAEATIASLLGDTDIDVSIGGLGLGLGSGPITSALAGVLGGAAPSLDNLLNALTDLIGVGLGEADVRVNGLRCRDAALVA